MQLKIEKVQDSNLLESEQVLEGRPSYDAYIPNMRK